MSEALWRSAEYEIALGSVLPSGPEETEYLAKDKLAMHDRLARLYELRRDVSKDPIDPKDKEAILSRIAYGIRSIESGTYSSRSGGTDQGKSPLPSDVNGGLEDGTDCADNAFADFMPDSPRVMYFLGGALLGYIATEWFKGREERTISERAHRDARTIYEELSKEMAKESQA